jgi:hypothetical protein
MIPTASLLLLDCAFIVHLYFFGRQLPERVASHFQFGGQADAWVNRRTYLALMAFMGPGLSLASIAFVFALRNTPARLLGEHVVWAGCLLLAFIFGVHWLTIQANRRVPPELPMKPFWVLLGMLQIGLALWVWELTKLKI